MDVSHLAVPPGAASRWVRKNGASEMGWSLSSMLDEERTCVEAPIPARDRWTLRIALVLSAISRTWQPNTGNSSPVTAVEALGVARHSQSAAVLPEDPKLSVGTPERLIPQRALLGSDHRASFEIERDADQRHPLSTTVQGTTQACGRRRICRPSNTRKGCRAARANGLEGMLFHHI